DRSLPEVRRLLDASPARLHAGDERSNQPIHWAVMTRQLDMFDALLARGADIDARRQAAARPLQLTNGAYHYRGWPERPAQAARPRAVLGRLQRPPRGREAAARARGVPESRSRELGGRLEHRDYELGQGDDRAPRLVRRDLADSGRARTRVTGGGIEGIQRWVG